MTHVRSETTWIGRLYAAVIETSVIAVAVHYAAPWNPALGKRASHRA
jgi:hypothetical protein